MLHERADEPLDNPPKVRLPHGTMHQTDAVLLTTTPEGLAMKLRAIIDVDGARFAPNGPLPLQAKTVEIRRFVQHCVGEAEAHRHSRRSFEGQAESRDAAAVDIDSHGQKRAANRLPCVF